MRNLVLVFLATATFSLTSCEKEENLIMTDESSMTTVESYEKDAPRRGEIGCIIFNNSGGIACLGKRCGTPTGDCGKGYSDCECVDIEKSNTNLPNGMTFDEFKIMWNSDEGRDQLIEMGYYERDIK